MVRHRERALAHSQRWLECLETRALLTTVLIDYSLDTNNFFDTQDKKDLLQTVADSLAGRLVDNLLAITPGPSGLGFDNTWDAIFDHPATGADHGITDLTLSGDTIIIYAGGRDLAGSTVGQGGPGGFSTSGTTEFNDTVAARGQAGALLATETDFSLWGGAITFDTANDWHFGLTTDDLDSNETDFFSVAQHEIGHLLGIGTADSWQNQVVGSSFTGAASVAAFGGNVPLFGDLSHWAENTTSNGQTAAMNASLLNGTRALFTDLDVAALSDIGWEVAQVDYGDAPDSGLGTGSGNYETLSMSGGPSHTIVAGLFMGAAVDGEADATQNTTANGDDLSTLPDDEDGLIEPAQDLVLTSGSAPVVRVRATNTTGSEATLYGWIDFNRDGVFDNATERTSVTVPTATTNGTLTLTFPTISTSTTAGATYARFRLSTDVAAANSTGAADDGEVEDYAATITQPSIGTADSTKAKKIASGTNGGPTLANGDLFGRSVAALGDLDGDGVTDLAVGAYRDDTGDTDRGVVYVQFMNSNGTVKSRMKIASDMNGGPTLENYDYFGISVASLGDLDGDGVTDLAVGAINDRSAGSYRGAVHVLLLNATGTVKSSVKIASGTNGGPTLANTDFFGSSVTSLGDLDGDGVTDLAVGAIRDDTGAGGSSNAERGAVHVLLLNSTGTVKSSVKIASGLNGGPTLADGDFFGSSVASLGDLDGDGVTDLAVGARYDDTTGSAGSNRGAVHVLLLNSTGTVKSSVKIASGLNGGPTLANGDSFGVSLASLGDLDGDGVTDLAVGASLADTLGENRGAVHLLLLNSNGTVKSSVPLASGTNGGPTLANNDTFGVSVASLGDLDGDGVIELAVGAYGDDTGGSGSIADRGAVHVLFLNLPGDVGDAPDTGAGTGTGNYQTLLADGGPSHVITTTQTTLFLGARVDGEVGVTPNKKANGDDITTLPDDEDGLIEPAQDLVLTVGTASVVRVRATNMTGSTATLYGWIDGNRDGVFDNATERTSVAVPTATSNGTFILTFPTIPLITSGGTTYARFRLSTDVAAANSTGLAKDGEVEDYVATITRRSEGDVASFQKIASGTPNGPALGTGDLFGSSIAALGDLDGDGVTDLAIGTPSDDTGSADRGSVFVIFMNADGTVKGNTKIASGTPNGPALGTGDLFGSSVAALGDLDGDGVTDLAIGTPSDDTGSADRGSVFVLFLRPVNQPPVITSSATASMAENTTSVLMVMATDADVPAQTLSFSIVGGADQNQFDITSDGVLTFKSSPDFESPTDAGTNPNPDSIYEVTVQVSDGNGGTATQPVTVTVTDVNEFNPTVSGGPFSVAENSANVTSVGTVSGSDGDATNGGLSYSITGGNSLAIFAISSSTGAITVADKTNLDREVIASVMLTVQVSDNGPGSARTGSTGITINVLDVNEFNPTVSGGPFSVAENSANGSSIGTVSGSDGDATNGGLSYSITSGNGLNIFAINSSTGEITVADKTNLDREAISAVTLTVQVSDNGPGSARIGSTSVTINVTDVNEFNPTVSGGPFSVVENSANLTSVGSVSGSDGDTTNGGLSYSITGGNGLGIFAINSSTGEITVTDQTTLDRELTPSVTLTVQVSDGGPGSARTEAATVTINLIDVNEFDPVLNDVSLSIAENTANGSSVGTLTATDTDATKTLSYSITAGNGLGIFTINSSTGTIKIGNNANLDRESAASVTLTVQVSDSGPGTARTDSATVTINVTDVNEFDPVLDAVILSIAENSANGSSVGIVTASDSDVTKSFSYSITAGNGLGFFAINSATGEITVANNANLDRESVASVTLTVQVSDGGPGTARTDSTALTINVTDVNEFDPVLNDATFSIAENLANESSVGSVTATDADATKTFIYSITAGNSLGIFAIHSATGAITIADKTNLDRESLASVTLTVQASDGGSGSARTDTATVTINVTDVNEFDPVLDDATFSVAENSANNTSVGTVTASDSDTTKSFSYSITAGNSLGIFAIDSSTGAITITDKTNLGTVSPSSVSLTVQVSDSGPGTARGDTATVTINVSEVNDAPTGVNDPLPSVAEDSGVRLIPLADLLVNDVKGPSNEIGQTLTITAVSDPVGGTVTINGTNVEFTPADNFHGTASFTYTLRDDGTTNGASDFLTSTANVSFTVTAVNDIPSFTGGANVGRPGDGVQKTVLGWATNISRGPANEAGQALSFVITTDNDALFATNGLPTIDPSTGNLMFTPKAVVPTTGTATVTVRLHDNGGGDAPDVDTSANQTFTITLTGLNKIPSFKKGANQAVLEDAGPKTVANWATAISAGAGDVGQAVNFVVTNNNNLLFSEQPTISPTGVLTYKPAANANGSATVTVILKDDAGTNSKGKDTSTTATFTITVTAVNDVPSFTLANTTLSVLEKPLATKTTLNSFATNLSKGPANEASQKLNFLVTNDNAALFKTAPAISVAGVLTYTLNPHANGTANVNVKIKDNGGVTSGGGDTSATQVFTINVTSVNDAPSFKKGADQSTNEDVATTAANWATLISAGAANESAQSLDFQVSNDNSGLFAVQPSIAANGILTYTPKLNTSGVANFTVRLHDNGGGTAPDANLSAAQTFKITIKPVNDEPLRTAGTLSTINVDEDSVNVDAVTLGLSGLTFAPGPSTAVDEVSQTLTYKITAIPAFVTIFKVDGTTAVKLNGAVTAAELQGLKYKTVASLFGTDNLKFTVTDNGSGTAPNVNSLTESVSITVNRVVFDLTVAVENTDNTVTVSKIGNNLVVRRDGLDVITPRPLEDVASLTITGGIGKDTVLLDASLNSAGSPAFHKFIGQIVVHGNGNDDKLDASKINIATFGITFNGGPGNDTALGGSGHETLNGGDNNDVLNGGVGDDVLNGGKGDDQLLGGAGNDTYLFADTDTIETDTLTEASNAGTDVLDFSNVTTAVTVKLTSETTLAMHTNRTIKTSATGTAKLAPNFENVIGGAGDDQILGNAASNSLLGGAGRDTIIGGAGNDTLRGGDDDDTLIGGLGADSVFGDSGADLGLGGKGGVARGGTGVKNTGDILNASVETINEAFASVFAFE